MIQKLTVAAGILGAVTTLGAQAPSQQSPADRPTNQPAIQQPSPQPNEAARNEVTISGCLKPGVSPGSFILADAGMAPEMPAGQNAPPAAKGTTGSTKRYDLVAKPGEDLTKHLNHKVEVTGTVSASRPPSAPVPEAAPATAVQPTETLTVQTFKMVAAACP
jgi:hypothetical protein